MAYRLSWWAGGMWGGYFWRWPISVRLSLYSSGTFSRGASGIGTVTRKRGNRSTGIANSLPRPSMADHDVAISHYDGCGSRNQSTTAEVGLESADILSKPRTAILIWNILLQYSLQ